MIVAQFLRRRREWFEPHMEMYFVLWWSPAGEIPTVEQAKTRLKNLQVNGESEFAFTFKKQFPAPESISQERAMK